MREAFFIPGITLTDRRLSVSPVHFKEQMFLFCNAELWGISDINDVVNNNNKDGKA